MTALRDHLLRHRALAAWLVALALVMRLIVPTGYMVGVAGGSVAIVECSGYAPRPVPMAMPGMMHHAGQDHGPTQPDHRAEQPCGFSGLSAPLLGAPPPLVGAVIAFVLAVLFRIVLAPARVALPARLRPPLRGPPLLP